MRRLLTIVAVLATFAVIGTVVAALPKAPRACTQSGTSADDVMNGNAGADVLCGRGGKDYIHGDGGGDRLRGGANNDVLVGAGGRDSLRGGAGKDRLFAVDERGGERLDGGKGNDQCYADVGDRTFGCESTFTGLTIEVVQGLVRVAYQVAAVAIAESGSTVTVTQTITQTVTQTVSPECSPPPTDPPPPCNP